jgi:hypothetical protein
MSGYDNGGPAFPQHPDMPSILGCIPSESDAGMSLRDYFAAAAMQGLLAANPKSTVTSEFLAAEAYGIAESMLEERLK